LEPYLQEGFAKTKTDKDLRNFDIAPLVNVVLGDDLEACRQKVREYLALYIGGMGPRDHNFYHQYAGRMGYESEARSIQDLYLSGEKVRAAAEVPDQLVDDVALVGPADRIRDRLQAWKQAGRHGHVGSLLVGGASIEALRLLAEELL
jgi:alkanesulfonate monooxygenase SsuD/methylene tetrahydromethanopterin reductase-like flavin-dependent oxidoreductase (luciferase family)